MSMRNLYKILVLVYTITNKHKSAVRKENKGFYVIFFALLPPCLV